MGVLQVGVRKGLRRRTLVHSIMNLCVFDDKDETFLDGFLTGRGVDIALSGAGSFPPIYFADAEHDDYGGSLVYSEVVLGQGGETLQGFSPERKGDMDE